MSGHHTFSATRGHLEHDDSPQHVARLASERGWAVDRSPTTGDWSTAEWHDHRDCGEWRIGLTPVRPDLVAAMLWSGDRLVHHTRGTEAAMCAKVRRWISTVTETGDLASR